MPTSGVEGRDEFPVAVAAFLPNDGHLVLALRGCQQTGLSGFHIEGDLVQGAIAHPQLLSLLSREERANEQAI